MNLQLFSFNDQLVRVISVNGDPWFVAQDVCSILDLGNVSQACKPLKAREKDLYNNDTLGGKQDVVIISESGLYRLTMKSRKPQAEPFQDWVCEEILPSIRKTGKYEVVPSQSGIKTSIPVIASRELALETARSVSEIKDLLADTDPRLCQLLVDVAINDAVNSIKAITPASETQWMGVAEIAEYLKLPITLQNRTSLGKFVKAACGNIGKQESRICNGRMMLIWCYPFPNSEVEKAVKNFFK